MYTNGIYLQEARYEASLSSVLSATFEVWNIRDQCPYFYQVWVNPNNSGGSSIKKKHDGEWVDVFRGDYKNAISIIKEILSTTGTEWTYSEFACYVAGWCDAKRR